MKICGKCKQEKERSLFYGNNRSKDGLASKCIECCKEYRSSPEVKERNNKRKRDRRKIDPEFREKNRARSAEYHKNNRDYANQKRREWEINNKEKAKKTKAEYYQNNKERHRELAREWEKNNPEKVKALAKRTRERHKDAIRLKNQRYHEQNPHLKPLWCAQRRSAKLQATPLWANEFFMKEVYELAKLRSLATGIVHHVDHIVPLKSKLVCGLNNEFNLQVIPATENLKKSNTWWPQMPEPEKITQAA